jgi:tetratricopeptide (TPR) repeat protein
MEPLPFVWRVNNAFVSYVTYIWEMIWPARLAIFYPHPQNHLALWEIALAIVLLIAMTALAFALRKQCPYLIVGWFWYLVMLAPVIGVVQVNLQGHADRYTYLAQIGLYLLVVWSIADLSVSWPYRRQILSAAAAIVIVALGWRAWTQTRYWRDSESLWTHTIAVTSDNDIAHVDLADLLLRRDRVSEAVFHSQEALRIRPGNADAHNTLGIALFQMGDLKDAVAHWKQSLEIQPGNMNAQVNLAWALATAPDASLRDGARSVELAQNVVRRVGHPNAMVLRTLAAGYAESGRFSDAIDTAEGALQLAIAQNNSALANDLQLNIASYQRELPLRDPGIVTAAPTP